ncbi:hypothetical protein NKJ23_25580 [Mesorhizobium sp. M0184]|uniref:hypothetical protein n=1 Tax=Mesorhizobium sp. M0184 TaxID=2956906 RepID=UPI00333A7240
MNKVADKLLDMALNSSFSTARAGGIFGAIGAYSGSAAAAWCSTSPVVVMSAVLVPRPATAFPAMLSDGEFVVNARAKARDRALLDAINSGSLPALASGLG